jgi:hypothetical protein
MDTMSVPLIVYRGHTVDKRQTPLARCRVQRFARRWFFGRWGGCTSHGRMQSALQHECHGCPSTRQSSKSFRAGRSLAKLNSELPCSSINATSLRSATAALPVLTALLLNQRGIQEEFCIDSGCCRSIGDLSTSPYTETVGEQLWRNKHWYARIYFTNSPGFLFSCRKCCNSYSVTRFSQQDKPTLFVAPLRTFPRLL